MKYFYVMFTFQKWRNDSKSKTGLDRYDTIMKTRLKQYFQDIIHATVLSLTSHIIFRLQDYLLYNG